MSLQKLNPLRIGAELFKHRHIVAQLTKRDVLLKYRGSYLGISWSFLYPLLMLLAFTFVFGQIFTARWPQTESAAPAALVIYCGLIVFSIFSEIASRAPVLILGYPSYVKKIIFPLETLPLMLMLSAFIHGAINLAILLIGVLLFGQLHATVLLAPIVLIPLALFSLGLAWFLAASGVFVRDLVNVMPVFVQIILFLSPVFYPISAVPKYFHWFHRMNPLSIVIEDFRRVALWGEMPHWEAWGQVLAVSIGVAVIGYAFFVRSKEQFADVV